MERGVAREEVHFLERRLERRDRGGIADASERGRRLETDSRVFVFEEQDERAGRFLHASRPELARRLTTHRGIVVFERGLDGFRSGADRVERPDRVPFRGGPACRQHGLELLHRLPIRETPLRDQANLA